VHTIDEQDKRILSVLQKNCRVSSQELADAANTSSATCWRRVRSLEEAGLIEDYRAILNQQGLGYGVTIFVHVSVERQKDEVVKEIEERIAANPMVMECYATTGDADFMLRVVAKDIDSYDQFLQSFLFKLPGVSQVRSNIALREIKQTTELPLE